MERLFSKTQYPQPHFTRTAPPVQHKTRKPQSKPKTVAPQQLGLFAPSSSRVMVGVEVAAYRSARFCVTIRQADLIWQLPPSLPKNRAFDLLDLLQEAGCCFQLDENEGTPIDGRRINKIAERFIDSIDLGGAA